MHLKNNAHANVAVLQPATRDGRPLRLLPTRAIAAGLLLSIAAPVTAQSSQSTCAPAKQAADVETVQGLEREWLAAEYRGDTGFLDCLLSPDYQVIQARKKTIKSKADLLAVVARKQGSTAKPPQLDTIVSISGARATAYSSIPSSDGGTAASYVDFYEYRGGRWVAVSGVDL